MKTQNFSPDDKKVRKKEFNSKTERKTREGIFYCCSLFTQENVCEIRFNKLECDESFTFGFQDKFLEVENVSWRLRCSRGVFKFSQSLANTLACTEAVFTQIKLKFRWLCKQVLLHLQILPRMTKFAKHTFCWCIDAQKTLSLGWLWSLKSCREAKT